MHFAETDFGFEYGAVAIERTCSDHKKGWVSIAIRTPKHPEIQLYVTKTGKVRIADSNGEWIKPKPTKQKREKNVKRK